jgi:hypothetical protein
MVIITVLVATWDVSFHNSPCLYNAGRAKGLTRMFFILCNAGPNIKNILADEALERIEEGKFRAIGRDVIRIDAPHVPGDKEHAHSGNVSYNVDGTRHHPNKFRAHVTQNTRNAIAKALG